MAARTAAAATASQSQMRVVVLILILILGRLSAVANWLMAKLSGVSLHDFGTTFKAYRAPVIKRIRLHRPRPLTGRQSEIKSAHCYANRP